MWSRKLPHSGYTTRTDHRLNIDWRRRMLELTFRAILAPSLPSQKFHLQYLLIAVYRWKNFSTSTERCLELTNPTLKNDDAYRSQEKTARLFLDILLVCTFAPVSSLVRYRYELLAYSLSLLGSCHIPIAIARYIELRLAFNRLA